MVMADLQQIIGNRYKDENGNPINGGEGSFRHVSEHTILGCIMGEALGGTCATGALAGMGQAIYAGMVDPTQALRDSQTYLANAELIGGLLAALGSGGDVNATMIASGIARSGFQNNYLNHAERELHEQLVALCYGPEPSPDACRRLNELNELSEKRDQQIERCVGDAHSGLIRPGIPI